MKILNLIKYSENTFPKHFAEVNIFNNYIVYIAKDNPNSHDSNHALILNLEHDPEQLITDAESFFIKNGITPRFYPAWIENEYNILNPIFIKNGYIIEADSVKMYINTNNCSIKDNPNYALYRLSEINNEICTIIELDEGGDWNIRRLKKLISDNRFHFMALMNQNNIIVGMCGLFITNKISRIDDVIIHPYYRNKGYCSQLMYKIIEYHNTLCANSIFLLAEDPAAVHVYKKAGFIEINTDLINWRAYKK